MRCFDADKSSQDKALALVFLLSLEHSNWRVHRIQRVRENEGGERKSNPQHLAGLGGTYL
jgi:hypothetical protein